MIAKKCEINPEKVVSNLAQSVGDTGSAHSLLMFASVLEKAKAGEKILVCGFGGGSDVLLFETTDNIKNFKPQQTIENLLETGVEENNYMKFLTFNDTVKWEKGMRASKIEKLL